MGKHKIRHLVVTEADRAIAIVSIRDVLSQIHHNDELEVNVLRDMALASRGIIAA
jgi:signal-transduction protein with cAMP-binding, CBS, and nucleotidyltransferase domain